MTRPPTIESLYVSVVRQLGHDANVDAVRSINRLSEEVRLHLTPNAHRYELLARQQYLAAFADRAAIALQQPHPASTPVEVVEGVADAYLAAHSPGRDELLSRAIRAAVARVRLAVERLQREDEARFADEDHAAGFAEDERRTDGTYGVAEAFGSEL